MKVKNGTYPTMVKLEDLKNNFFEIINLCNNKTEKYNYDKYIKSFSATNFEYHVDILLRPSNIIY